MKGPRDIVLLSAMAFVGLLLACAAGADLFSPYSPDFRAETLLLAPPSTLHLLGTDEQGRDILSLLIHSSRVAVIVGFGATLLSMAVGVPLGLLAGWRRGLTDSVVMGVSEVVFAFPGILLAILLVFITRKPSILNIVAALSATGWAGWARLVRGQVLQEREKEYVDMAILAGAGTTRILAVHILPNIASVILVQASFSAAVAILSESSLSFLGLGPQDMPSWGSTLSDGAALFISSPYVATFSGLAIFLSVLSFNVVGDRLRDRFAGESVPRS